MQEKLHAVGESRWGANSYVTSHII